MIQVLSRRPSDVALKEEVQAITDLVPPVYDVANGLLLRSDLHTLFDEGYLSVDPKERRLLVSKRIREEFENGKDYYRLEGHVLREPTDLAARPLTENLEYHASVRFRG